MLNMRTLLGMMNMCDMLTKLDTFIALRRLDMINSNYVKHDRCVQSVESAHYHTWLKSDNFA